MIMRFIPLIEKKKKKKKRTDAPLLGFSDNLGGPKREHWLNIGLNKTNPNTALERDGGIM